MISRLVFDREMILTCIQLYYIIMQKCCQWNIISAQTAFEFCLKIHINLNPPKVTAKMNSEQK